MQKILNQSFTIGTLQLSHRLLQGPLAGYSCAPFRELFNQFLAPAYCVSEMISAYDILYKHDHSSRYLYRSPDEKRLCYQLAGSDPKVVSAAARRLVDLNADLIDINCGCPKSKIRKKGAGSALLEKPELLIEIVRSVREAIDIPLTVKVRLCGEGKDVMLAKALEQSGADALIVHGRRSTEDYDVPCNLIGIRQIKEAISIPVIANGDIADQASLHEAIKTSGCDAYMLSRAGTGKPWLYQQLLEQTSETISYEHRNACFIQHLQGLSRLENEHKAVLQSKSLARYYFKDVWDVEHLKAFYDLKDLQTIFHFVSSYTPSTINR